MLGRISNFNLWSNEFPVFPKPRAIFYHLYSARVSFSVPQSGHPARQGVAPAHSRTAFCFSSPHALLAEFSIPVTLHYINFRLCMLSFFLSMISLLFYIMPAELSLSLSSPARHSSFLSTALVMGGPPAVPAVSPFAVYGLVVPIALVSHWRTGCMRWAPSAALRLCRVHPNQKPTRRGDDDKNTL